MRKSIMIVALGISLMAVSTAVAGPSSHELGRVSATYQGNAEERRAGRNQPYRLTGAQQQQLERRIEYRALPQGRGQFHWVPFVVTAEK